MSAPTTEHSGTADSALGSVPVASLQPAYKIQTRPLPLLRSSLSPRATCGAGHQPARLGLGVALRGRNNSTYASFPC